MEMNFLSVANLIKNAVLGRIKSVNFLGASLIKGSILTIFDPTNKADS